MNNISTLVIFKDSYKGYHCYMRLVDDKKFDFWSSSDDLRDVFQDVIDYEKECY